MGVSVRTLDMLLHDLSTGDKPELMLYKDRGLNGYTMISVSGYDNYQDKNVQKLHVNDDDNVQKLQDNMQKLTQNTPSNVQKLTNKRATVAPYITCDNMLLNNNNNNKQLLDDVVYSSTDVGSSFEELIEIYPKVNSHKVETVALFNGLDLDEKKKCVTFAKQLQLIWKQNGIQDKYQFMKSCHTFVEDKMFNGKPKDIFPREVSTEVVNEYTKEELECIEKNKNYKTSIERFREQQQKENI